MSSGDNKPISDLIFERIEDTLCLSDFACGIEKMDDFIHHKLQNYMNQTPCETYIVLMEQELRMYRVIVPMVPSEVPYIG